MLASVALLVTIVFLPLQPGRQDLTPTAAVLFLSSVAVVVIGCWAARYRRIPALIAWALVPLLAVVAIVVLDLLTSDVSVAAQVFFFFPTLYGASQLRRAGAVVMTAASVVGGTTDPPWAASRRSRRPPVTTGATGSSTATP